METTKAGENQVVLERDLLAHMLESAERMQQGITAIVEGLRVASTPLPAEEVEPLAVEPAGPRVWATDEVSMREYDGEQLVALRADHRADNHDPADCAICKVLERRLGSL